ncbi:MAG TPA: endonuclease/exonuclease/phosphatase family protein [Pyrinomonadaceae bacterium]|nr:endonuclease/exonuclease/phosphatase family protein [Pyrinomonadaceae bacterium]
MIPQRPLTNFRIFFAVFLLQLTLGGFITVRAEVPAGRLLSFAELTELYERDSPNGELKARLDYLLTNPFVSNRHPAAPQFRRDARLGEYLRIAHWNIQRGVELDAIKAIFAGESQLRAVLDAEKFEEGSKRLADLLEEAEMLRAADVIVLNEVDLGVKRSGYRNVAEELAEVLGMNYAFGVQFIELSPLYLADRFQPADEAERELMEIFRVDRELYKGLHGIAILSRFPLENVRLVPFEYQPYDWYLQEKRGPSMVEKGKRGVAKTVFREKTMREVRRGGRTTLFADIVDDRLPTGRATVVATHLESRTKPKGRLRQFNELLSTLRAIDNPVILAGDLNTSASDLTPTTLRREIMMRIGDPKYWMRQAATYALGVGLLEEVILASVTFGRNHSDPTVKHIPFIAPNPERKLFDQLKKFRFEDGGAFDVRGDPERSIGGKKNIFANSNQRGKKGFVTTYQVSRPIMFIGKYKLDWIFVKPPVSKEQSGKQGSYTFAPHFGRTLIDLNEAIDGRISDHRPMIVDLPLDEPSM